MYVIYGLEDPRDHFYHYIGITDDVYARFEQHITGDGGNVKKNGWIFECRQANLMILMKEIERVQTRIVAENRETFWIQYYLQSGHPLHNLHKAKLILEEEADLERQYQKLLATRERLAKQIQIRKIEKAEQEKERDTLDEWPIERILDLHKQGLSLRSISSISGWKYYQVQQLIKDWSSRANDQSVDDSATIVTQQ